MPAFNDIHPLYMLAGGAAAGMVLALVWHFIKQIPFKRRK